MWRLEVEKTILRASEGDKDKRLDLFVLENTNDLTRARITNLIKDGHILLGGKVVKAGYKLRRGDEVEVYIPEDVALNLTPQNVDFEILYEDEHMLVINKPQGLVVHPSASCKESTLVNGLLYRVKNLSSINGVTRPGIVHRLDKNTSGVMLVAKTDLAHASLSKQIETKTCKRKYYALLEGVVTADEKHIETNIARSQSDRKKMAVVERGKGRVAISDMVVLKRFNHYTLCEFSLKTGRTHQIRVHAKHIGHPVVGDDVYGKKDTKFCLVGQLLHSHFIEFTHPMSGERMSFECKLPKYFQDVLDKIG